MYYENDKKKQTTEMEKSRAGGKHPLVLDNFLPCFNSPRGTDLNPYYNDPGEGDENEQRRGRGGRGDGGSRRDRGGHGGRGGELGGQQIQRGDQRESYHDQLGMAINKSKRQ